jgi:hypothetical protein
MLTFNNSELVALQSGSQRLAVFFRLDTTPAVRLWLGFGNIEPGINVYDPSGAVYQGFGELSNIPAFNQLLNGTAARVSFTLSGVSGEVLAIASGGDADQVKSKRAAVGFGLMDKSWVLLGEVHWCVSYTADYLSISQQPTGDATTPTVRTIALSCGTRFTGRRRPSFSYFSDTDQQGRFPGDVFCSQVGNYANGFNKNWPVFT